MSTRTSQRTARAASTAARNTQAQGQVTEVVDASAEVIEPIDDVPAADVLNDALTDVDDDAADDASEDVFAQFMQGEDEVLDKDEIIRQLLASGKCKLLKGLHIKNVVATKFDTHSLLTFVVKEWVVGDTRSDELDAYGYPVVVLGRTHNVQTSSYAVAGIAKDSPKGAIFAADIVDDPSTANMLYAGGTIDVILQYVKEGEEYANPFASNSKPTHFDRDKVIHHVIALTSGEVGADMYHERLKK